MFFAPVDEWSQFLSGHDRATPAGIAWALETFAVKQGWPSGISLGTESQLMTRFHASRDAIRQAVRVLESRGSMRMQRGAKGGLYLLQTNVDAVAGGLAMHVRAWGISATELVETFAVADELFAELGSAHLVSQLYARTRDVLRGGAAVQRQSPGRAMTIALDFVQQFAPISESGVYIGSESELCERFDSCRSTARQALRVLHELGMLRVKRGRSGGYWLMRPSPMSLIRRLFSLLGSQHQRLQDVVPATWVLNLIQLRLVLQQLQRQAPEHRAQLYESLRALLASADEPYRWASLQHAFAERASNIVVAALQRGIVAYQARLGAPTAAYATISRELHASEQAIIEALRRGADHEAVQAQRAIQDRLSELLQCPTIPLSTGAHGQ